MVVFGNREVYDSNPLMISGLAIVKNKDTPMDLVRVETRNQILYSFLAVGWGFIADVDIESESLRAIGGQRFTVWSFKKLIGLRTYNGKVSYLPCEKMPLPENNCNGNDREYGKISHSKSFADELDNK